MGYSAYGASMLAIYGIRRKLIWGNVECKSANIIPTVLRCSATFFKTVVYIVIRKIDNYIVKGISGIIGGAKRLIDQVAIANDTPPPFVM